MLHRATLPTLTLAALVVLTGPADAQFTTSSTYRNLLPAAVPYLDDEGLRKELKLSAEQAKKLTEIQQEWRSVATTAARGSTARGEDAARQIDRAFTEALKPDQLQRLKQILLQDLEKRYGLYRPFSYDEVARALNLTAQQRADIANARRDGRTENVLTAEQQKKWKELIGEPYAAQLQPAGVAAFGPAASRFTSGPEMPELTWLRTEPVKRELKLTAEQGRQVIALIDARDTTLRDYLSTPREQRVAKVAEADRGAWDGLAKLLQPEQLKRLRQISAQQEQRRKGDLDFLRAEAVRQRLKITSAQAEKMDALVKGCRDAMRQAVLSSDPVEKIEEKLKTSQQEAHAALLATLTEEQRTGVKDVLGEPFELPPTPDRSGWGTFTRDAAPVPARANRSGLGAFASFTALSGNPLAIEAVQKELKMTAEQLAEAPRLAALPSGTEQTATELARVLKAEQVARLRQIRMQQVVYLGGPACVFRYREAVEAVALTDEQKTKLQSVLDEAVELYMTRNRAAEGPLDETTRKNAESRLNEVLTPEQQKKLAALFGEPFKGALAPVAAPAAGGFPALPPGAVRGGLPGFPTRPGTELGTGSSLTVSLLSLPEVQKELRLTPEQVRRVPELSDRRSSFAALTNPAVEAEVERVLNADQIRRLRQLSLQQMERLAGAGYLLLYRDVLESLRPSEEQVATFQTILSEATRAYNSRTSTAALPAEERKKAQARLDEVLTAEQRRTFSDVLGESFAGELPIQTPSRGPTSRDRTRDRGPMPFGPPGPRTRIPAHPSLRYLTRPDVVGDLKLTQEQTRKMLDVAAKRDEALADYGTLPTADRQKKLADANAAADKAITNILDAKQNTRLKQIVLQQREELFLGAGPNAAGFSIFNEPDIVAELKLSAEQQEKIAAAVQHAVKVQELIQRQQWGEAPPLEEHRTAVLERVRGVLTKEQREKWGEMIGEPFKGQTFGPGGPLP